MPTRAGTHREPWCTGPGHMSSARETAVRAVALGALGVYAIALAGCAGSGTPGTRAGESDGRRELSSSQAPVAAGIEDQSVIEGLEVRWWLADDTDGAVGAALARFAEPVREPAAIMSRWEASGLRLVRMPRDRWPAVEPALVPLNQRVRDLVGWAPEWREVFRGRRVGGEQPIIVDGARASLDRGVFRLLLRTFPAPPGDDASRRGEVHTELAFQVVPITTGRNAPFETPRLQPVQDEGEVIRRLTLSAPLDPGYVYVLTSEAPGVEWSARDEAAPPDPAETDAMNQSEAQGVFELGPPASGPRTLGEAALGASAQETGSRGAKAVIVLMPRAPASFQLLP